MKKIDYPQTLDFEQQRSEFILDLKRFIMNMSIHNSLTVVFDGHPQNFNYNNQSDNRLKVFYSIDEEADDVILRMVSKAINPKTIVVVTEDREIIKNTKSYGVQLLRSTEFISRLNTKKYVKNKNFSVSDKGTINISRINNELMDIWRDKYKD